MIHEGSPEEISDYGVKDLWERCSDILVTKTKAKTIQFC